MGYASDNGIKAICFDIDGTFYPKWKMDLKLIKASVFHIPFALKYNRCRKRIRKDDAFGLYPAMSYDEITRRGALLCFGNSSEYAQKLFRKKEKAVFHDFFLRSYRNIKPAKGVADALSIAKEEGFKLAALSDFPIGVKLKAMGIEQYFDFSISSEDLGHFKPSKTPFAALSERLLLKPNEILYVGDSYQKDVLGAKNYGMHSCLIFSKAGKEYTDADLSVQSWAEFIEKVF